jgi:WD40 repeat protein
MTLHDFLVRLDQQGMAERRALIFDQFEKFFTSPVERSDERRVIITQIGDALEDARRSGRRLKIVFAMREEYVVQFEPLAYQLPERLRTRMRLEPLRAREAMDAIRKPLEELDLEFERGHNDPVEALVMELRKIRVEGGTNAPCEIIGEFVEPLQLQVVCQNMWRNLPPELRTYAAERQQLPPQTERKRRIITRAQVPIEDVDRALSRYYEDTIATAVKDSGVTEGELRRWFSDSLITAAGMRRIVLAEDASTKRLPESALKVLKEQRLISSEQRGPSVWYELTHDRFIEPIQISNREWFDQWGPAEALRRKLEQKAAVRGARLDEVELREAERFLGTPTAELLGTTDAVKYLVRVSREEVDEEKRRKERELATERALKVRAYWLAFVALIAFIIAAFFSLRANTALRHAKQQGLLTRLMGDASKQKDKSLDLSLLLSIQAHRVADSMDPPTDELKEQKERHLADAKSRLLDALVSNSHLLSFGHGHTGAVLGIAATRDGKRFVSGGEDGTVIFWNKYLFPLAAPLEQHSGAVNAVAFRPEDEGTVASCSDDGTIRLWNAATFESELFYKQDKAIHSIAFSPKGEWLASGDSDGTIRIWDFAGKKIISSTPPGQHDGKVHRVVFNPAGGLLVSSGADNVARLWRVKDGELLEDPEELEGHPAIERSAIRGDRVGILSLAFDSTGTILVSGGHDGTVIRWKLTDKPPRPEPLKIEGGERAHTDGVFALAFSSDESTIASGSRDQTIKFWDAKSGEPYCRTFTGYSHGYYSLAFVKSNNVGSSWLLSGSHSGSLVLWETNELLSILSSPQTLGKGDWAECVAYHPKGTKVASGTGADGHIVITDLNTYEKMVLDGHTKRVRSLAFSPDGSTYASGAEDGKVILWGAARNEEIDTLAPKSSDSSSSDIVWALAYSPDGKTLVASGPANTISVWDLATRQLRSLPSDGSPLALAFSPNGETLASAGDQTTVMLWNVKDWQIVGRLPHDGIPASVAFSPDGETLATASGKEIRLWDWKTQRQVGEPLKKHIDVVNRVIFGPDGKTLASASEDTTVILWDIATRQPIGDLRSTAIVRDLAFSPDGAMLAAAGLDTTLWDVSFEKWLLLAGEIAGRDLTQEEWEEYFKEEQQEPTTPYGAFFQAHWHALRGAAEAREAFSKAAKWVVTTKDGRLNNHVAWWGTLHGFADVVLRASDAAVHASLRPADRLGAHDTRGVALACTGKLEEAAAEFEKCVEGSKKYLEESQDSPDFEAVREYIEPLLDRNVQNGSPS